MPVTVRQREIARKNGEFLTVLIPTPYPNCLPSCFYKLSSPIEYDIAISLGLGVVRMLNSPHPNEFMLYYFQKKEDEGFFVEQLVEELMLLKCYLHLTEQGKFHEPKLANFIEANIDTLLHEGGAI